MALVARNTCRRRRGASRSASAASSMSPRLQRASPQMIGPCTSRATALTLSQSPREAAGKPASMTSTPSSASAFATRSFSGCVMLQPGACSPSRRVVSKIRTRSGVGVIVEVSVRLASVFEPGHAFAQLCADPFDRMAQVLLEQALIVLRTILVLGDPLARKFAGLDLLQDLAHLFLGAIVDHA